MYGSPRRTELAEQFAKPFVDQTVGRHPALTAQAATDRPQCEEALVGRALPVALPDLQAPEERSNVVGGHGITPPSSKLGNVEPEERLNPVESHGCGSNQPFSG